MRFSFQAAGDNGQIKVKIADTEFDLEESELCDKDHLEVDNIVKMGKTFTVLCGNIDGDKDYKSSGNTVTIKFKVDEVHQAKGFNMQVIGEGMVALGICGAAMQAGEPSNCLQIAQELLSSCPRVALELPKSCSRVARPLLSSCFFCSIKATRKQHLSNSRATLWQLLGNSRATRRQ